MICGKLEVIYEFYTTFYRGRIEYMGVYPAQPHFHTSWHCSVILREHHISHQWASLLLVVTLWLK